MLACFGVGAEPVPEVALGWLRRAGKRLQFTSNKRNTGSQLERRIIFLKTMMHFVAA